MIQCHRAVGIEIGDVGEAAQLRQHGMRPGVDENAPAAQLARSAVATLDVQGGGVSEARIAFKQRQARRIDDGLLHAAANIFHDRMPAPLDFAQVHGHRAGFHAEIRRAARDARNICAGDKCIRGSGAGIDAVCALLAVVDERRCKPAPGRHHGKRFTRLAGADHNDVIAVQGALPSHDPRACAGRLPPTDRCFASGLCCSRITPPSTCKRKAVGPSAAAQEKSNNDARGRHDGHRPPRIFVHVDIRCAGRVAGAELQLFLHFLQTHNGI